MCRNQLTTNMQCCRQDQDQDQDQTRPDQSPTLMKHLRNVEPSAQTDEKDPQIDSSLFTSFTVIYLLCVCAYIPMQRTEKSW